MFYFLEALSGFGILFDRLNRNPSKGRVMLRLMEQWLLLGSCIKDVTSLAETIKSVYEDVTSFAKDLIVQRKDVTSLAETINLAY